VAWFGGPSLKRDIRFDILNDYDKYAASGDNSIVFSYWFDLAQASGRGKVKGTKKGIMVSPNLRN